MALANCASYQTLCDALRQVDRLAPQDQLAEHRLEYNAHAARGGPAQQRVEDLCIDVSVELREEVQEREAHVVVTRQCAVVVGQEGANVLGLIPAAKRVGDTELRLITIRTASRRE